MTARAFLLLPILASLLTGPLPASTGAAPSLLETNFRWPVPAGAKPSPVAPQGKFRLVHDPAVEREAVALSARLRAEGLQLAVEARALPRTEMLYPVLAFAANRGADLGVFLWHVAPEQTVGVHRESGVPAEELRLHAPVEPYSFASGEAWILAHPSRVPEAIRLQQRLQQLAGPQAMVDITVSGRGTIGPDSPADELAAPDPTSRSLAWLLQTAGLAQRQAQIRPLRLPARQEISPDLVIILRGEPGAAPQGLSADQVSLLSRDNRILLHYKNGQWGQTDVASIAGHSLALWTKGELPASSLLAGHSAEEESEISDEEMGLGADALERSRSELKALGIGETAIKEYNKLTSELAAKREAESKDLSDATLARTSTERRAATERALVAQKAEEQRLQPIVNALAAWEKAVMRTERLDQLGLPLAQLIKELDQAGATALADAFTEVFGAFLYQLGGVRGYFDFMMAVPDKRLSTVLRRIEPSRKPHAQAFARANHPRTGVPNTPEVQQAEAAWPAVRKRPDNSGPQKPKTDGVFDLTRLHRAVASGATAAAHELGAIYHQGFGAPQDRTVSQLWSMLFNRLHPGKPDPAKATAATAAFLLRAGVPSVVTQDAIKRLTENRYRLTEETFRALERSATQGDLLAERYIQSMSGTIALRREGITFEQIHTAAAPAFENFDAKLAELQAQGAELEQLIRHFDQTAAYMAHALATNPTAITLPTFAAAAQDAPSEEELLVTDEEMGLGADALEQTRAELKAVGISEDAMDEYTKRTSELAANREIESRDLGDAPRPRYVAKRRAETNAPGVELLQLNGFEGDIRAVRFLGGHYHAVTAQGVVLRSTDAYIWTQVFAAPAGQTFDDIVGGEGRLLIVPPAVRRISSQGKAQGWASFDRGRTWSPADVGMDHEIGYAAGKFWRYLPGDNAVYESSIDLKSWQRHAGIPEELLKQAPTLRLGHAQLFAGRVYRLPRYSHAGAEGAKIESSDDLRNWRLEFRLPTGAGATTPIQFNVESDTLVLGAANPLGRSKVHYHLLARGQSWRSVVSDHSALGGMASLGGWTLMHYSAAIGGYAEVTRGFSLIRFLGDLSGHSSQFAAGSAGFVLGGPQGRIAILSPDPRWAMRPAPESLAEARDAWLRGQYTQMQRLIDEARQDDPHVPEAWILEARSAFERNQTDWIFSTVNDGLKHHPRHPDLLGLRAYHHLAKQDAAAAKQDADAALAISAVQPEAALVRFMLTQGREKDALDTALSLDRHFVTGFVTRANYRAARGDRAGAVADLKAAEASRPKHPDFQLSLAGIYLQLGLPEDARRCANQARDLGHPRAAEALNLIPKP